MAQGVAPAGVKNTGSSIKQNERINTMPLIHLVITLVVVGVILSLINAYIPMQGTIKAIMNAVVIIVVGIWLLQSFGVIGSLSGLHIGK
jgi:hypothetical protein